MPVAFTCSIDDGHPSDMRMADLLDKHDLNATFYVPIRNREGLPVMPASAIRAISKRFEIGSHTLDHCFLNQLNFKQAQFQVIEGKRKLEDVLGAEVPGFCYPGGKYSRRHTALVRSAGFRYARTVMNLRFDGGDDPFEMPTTCQFYPHSRAVYVRNFMIARHWRRRSTGLIVALRKSAWIERLYALFDHACERSAVFHLWSHSSDVDALGAWQELDRFLSYVDSRVDQSSRLNNAQLSSRIHGQGAISTGMDTCIHRKA